MTTGHAAGYSTGMENKPLRFRVPPEVHEHNRQLRAAGVDTAAVVSERLRQLATGQRHPMYAMLTAAGYEVATGEAHDQDVTWLRYALNLNGEPFSARDERRFVALVYYNSRGMVVAGGVTEIERGDEICDVGQNIPKGGSAVVVHKWVQSRIKEMV